MISLMIITFIAFPDRSDSVFKKIRNLDSIEISSSGSLGFKVRGKCIKTHPNATVNGEKNSEWCSNVAPSSDEKPWIQYYFHDHSLQLTGYSVRNGCCYHGCCCIDDSQYVSGCCCDLYSFSLLGSNDGRTWKTIHKVENERNFYLCKYMTFEFAKAEPFRYFKLMEDAPYPGCAYCMVINQIDFYGDVKERPYLYIQDDNPDFDESISIIGKVRQN